MAAVPVLARLTLPPDVERLLMLGMSPVQLGIVSSLASLGGSATTRQLLDELGARRGTLVDALALLEADGYVVADHGAGERERVRTTWTLQHRAVQADLAKLAAAVEPRPAS